MPAANNIASLAGCSPGKPRGIRSAVIPLWVILSLGIPILSPALSSAETLSEAIRNRANSFYGTLKDKDIRSYSLRQEISQFFSGTRDLDQYIVTTLVRMEKNKINDTRIRSFRVVDIDLREGEARVTMKLRGYYILFLKSSFIQIDRWELRKTESGEEEWYLSPLPLEEGSGPSGGKNDPHEE